MVEQSENPRTKETSWPKVADLLVFTRVASECMEYHEQKYRAIRQLFLPEMLAKERADRDSFLVRDIGTDAVLLRHAWQSKHLLRAAAELTALTGEAALEMC